MENDLMKCRACFGTAFVDFIDLGTSPISNNFLSIASMKITEETFPLKVLTCKNCKLVQLPEHAKREIHFNSNYVYMSSYSKSWLEHGQRFTEWITKELNLSTDSFVVEIASNDGSLLKNFKEKGIPVLGVEPTSSCAEVAINVKDIETEIDFFGEETARREKAKYGAASLIIANNVLAHVPDIHDFIEGFKILLARNGTITFEFPELSRLIEFREFDTIYHEHYSYLSLTALMPILRVHQLRAIRSEAIETHGGSLRLVVVRDEDSRVEDETIAATVYREVRYNPLDESLMNNFRADVTEIKSKLIAELSDLKQSGKLVAGYGAAAKGNTLLNFAEIDSSLISFVVDKNPIKQGKFLPGSRIPVFHPKELERRKPDVIIIFPWNIESEIKEELAKLELEGCRYLVAIPSPRYTQ